MAPLLCDLPVELVERVVDFIPHPDTILHLRFTCRELNNKTLRCFSKAYLAHKEWALGPTRARALHHFSTIPAMAEFVTSVFIYAPRSNRTYENFWLAQGVEPVKLAIALSQFTQMHILAVVNFAPQNSGQDYPTFLHDFAQHLWIQKLEELRLCEVEMKAADTALILRRHRKTLKTLYLDNLDISSGPDPELLYCAIPWSDVFEAMKTIKKRLRNWCCASESIWEGDKDGNG